MAYVEGHDQGRRSHLGAWVFLAILLAVIAIGLALYRQDRSETRIGQAVNDLGRGIENATKDLQGHTPAERVGDTIKDAGQAIRNQVR